MPDQTASLKLQKRAQRSLEKAHSRLTRLLGRLDTQRITQLLPAEAITYLAGIMGPLADDIAELRSSVGI